MKKPSNVESSIPALTNTTTLDDGKFVRTAIILDGPKCGSIDIVKMIDGKLVHLGRLNVFHLDSTSAVQNLDDGQKETLMVDVIDTNDRFDAKRALSFALGERKSMDVKGKLIGCSFVRTKP